jgi:hypothetical protein
LKDQALQTFGLIRGALIMDTLKLNITNTVVVAALIAISMCMPVVAASLANHAGTGTHVSESAFPAPQTSLNIGR